MTGESVFRAEFTIRGDVERLSLNPGDVVVVTFPPSVRLSSIEARVIEREFRDLGIENEVIILDSGGKVSKLTGQCDEDCLEGCAYPGQFSECSS